MGDSAITETFGVGGMAMIAAPAVTRFVGAGGYEDALRTSTEMTEITIDRNPNFIIPNWNFQEHALGLMPDWWWKRVSHQLSIRESPIRWLATDR